MSHWGLDLPVDDSRRTHWTKTRPSAGARRPSWVTVVSHFDWWLVTRLIQPEMTAGFGSLAQSPLSLGIALVARKGLLVRRIMKVCQWQCPHSHRSCVIYMKMPSLSLWLKDARCLSCCDNVRWLLVVFNMSTPPVIQKLGGAKSNLQVIEYPPIMCLHNSKRLLGHFEPS